MLLNRYVVLSAFLIPIGLAGCEVERPESAVPDERPDLAEAAPVPAEDVPGTPRGRDPASEEADRAQESPALPVAAAPDEVADREEPERPVEAAREPALPGESRGGGYVLAPAYMTVQQRLDSAAEMTVELRCRLQLARADADEQRGTNELVAVAGRATVTEVRRGHDAFAQPRGDDARLTALGRRRSATVRSRFTVPAGIKGPLTVAGTIDGQRALSRERFEWANPGAAVGQSRAAGGIEARLVAFAVEERSVTASFEGSFPEAADAKALDTMRKALRARLICDDGSVREGSGRRPGGAQERGREWARRFTFYRRDRAPASLELTVPNGLRDVHEAFALEGMVLPRPPALTRRPADVDERPGATVVEAEEASVRVEAMVLRWTVEPKRLRRALVVELAAEFLGKRPMAAGTRARDLAARDGAGGALAPAEHPAHGLDMTPLHGRGDGPHRFRATFELPDKIGWKLAELSGHLPMLRMDGLAHVEFEIPPGGPELPLTSGPVTLKSWEHEGNRLAVHGRLNESVYKGFDPLYGCFLAAVLDEADQVIPHKHNYAGVSRGYLSLSTVCDTEGRTPSKYVVSYPVGVRRGSCAFRFTDLPTGLDSEPASVGEDGDVF